MLQRLSQLGLRAMDVVRITLQKVVLRHRLPSVARIPNAETIAALNEPTHHLKQFGSVDDLFADIEDRRTGEGREENLDHGVDDVRGSTAKSLRKLRSCGGANRIGLVSDR